MDTQMCRNVKLCTTCLSIEQCPIPYTYSGLEHNTVVLLEDDGPAIQFVFVSVVVFVFFNLYKYLYLYLYLYLYICTPVELSTIQWSDMLEVDERLPFKGNPDIPQAFPMLQTIYADYENISFIACSQDAI